MFPVSLRTSFFDEKLAESSSANANKERHLHGWDLGSNGCLGDELRYLKIPGASHAAFHSFQVCAVHVAPNPVVGG
jgi:hypothetical protein